MTDPTKRTLFAATVTKTLRMIVLSEDGTNLEGAKEEASYEFDGSCRDADATIELREIANHADLTCALDEGYQPGERDPADVLDEILRGRADPGSAPKAVTAKVRIERTYEATKKMVDGVPEVVLYHWGDNDGAPAFLEVDGDEWVRVRADLDSATYHERRPAKT